MKEQHSINIFGGFFKLMLLLSSPAPVSNPVNKILTQMNLPIFGKTKISQNLSIFLKIKAALSTSWKFYLKLSLKHPKNHYFIVFFMHWKHTAFSFERHFHKINISYEQCFFLGDFRNNRVNTCTFKTT